MTPNAFLKINLLSGIDIGGGRLRRFAGGCSRLFLFFGFGHGQDHGPGRNECKRDDTRHDRSRLAKA
jgi:hypothetical protein